MISHEDRERAVRQREALERARDVSRREALEVATSELMRDFAANPEQVGLFYRDRAAVGALQIGDRERAFWQIVEVAGIDAAERAFGLAGDSQQFAAEVLDRRAQDGRGVPIELPAGLKERLAAHIGADVARTPVVVGELQRQADVLDQAQALLDDFGHAPEQVGQYLSEAEATGELRPAEVELLVEQLLERAGPDWVAQALGQDQLSSPPATSVRAVRCTEPGVRTCVPMM